MKQEKRIPTILGLFLLLTALFAGVLLTSRVSNFSPRASGNCDPVSLQISNITHNSASISFTTTKECSATINIDNKTIGDFRFVDGKQEFFPSQIHYFEVTDLQKESSYHFSVISGGKNYDLPEYTFETAYQPNQQTSSATLAWGKILDSDHNPSKEAILYLNIPGASPLSAIVTSSGNWHIPLSTSFNQAKTNWFSPEENLEENIVVIAPNQISTQIINNTFNNNPVPDIIIGQNDFFTSQAIPDSQQVGDLPSIENEISSEKNLTINNPKDNEIISTQKPQFFGTAPLNSEITIKVESPVTLNGQVDTDNDGIWEWEVPQDLDPGEHTITVTAKNKDTGLIETISRKFIVLASDGETNFTASPSAQTNTPTPSPAPTATPTLIPTQAPTATPAVTRVEKPDTSSGVPQTGATLPTFIIIFTAIALMSTAFIFNSKKD